MLRKKMLRDIKANFAQFFSIMILSLIAMWCYTGFQANVIGGNKARNDFESSSNFADGWIYGADFNEEQAKKIAAISGIKDVQRRTEVLGKADEKYNTAEMYCYFQNSADVTIPRTVEGADFNADDENGLWLFSRFAETWGIKVGDKFTVHVMGLDIGKEVKGLIVTPEYEFACASTDTDTDFHNIGFAYLSQKALPEGMRISNELIFTCNGKALSYEKDIANALGDNYAYFADRNSIRGWYQLSDELAQHDSFSYIFSFVFVAIALLVIITTMKRMIAQQRTQIGTLNALGMKKRKILFHYLSYSFVLSTIGCILGIILGILTFGRLMVNMFSQFYTLPNWQPGFSYKSIIVAAVLVFICTGTSYLSCKQILKIHPSEALRPAAAKTAKPCIFEKLPFWKKLSFNVRYNLRDISRSKMRAFMGVFGTCMGMMIMELGLGAYDTVDYVRDWYFHDIQNYEYQVLLNDSCTPEQAEELKIETGGELIAMEAISIAAKEHPTSDGIISCKLAVTEGEQLYCVSDTELRTTPIRKGTVALTMKQAKKLGLSEGDKVYWKTATGSEWNESKIGLISRHPNITGITMLREDYEAVGMDFRPVMLVSRNNCENTADNDCVSAVHSMKDLIAAFDKMMEIMNLLVYFMVVFSVLLIVIVLYNSGNLSFNEREKEFATLKVLGFKSSAIRRLLSTQNLWLSIIGCILGLPLGRVPLQAMMDSNGDAVDWPCYIAPTTYIIAAIFVMTVSVLVSFMFSRRIKKIDMVEVLKGME
ncbi:ABC transporter permease [Ruminococcus flavefaciens]|uniref:Putative ABC transport system permease protein n=1 Tax=Ruminococcus flavefaciens TaxID=1265 RepID=A0A1K1MXI1_RUMFL|nr:ABC transporter permease [Ruminococcus flavefaciens]SFW27701.1 putative ABC transport system permease protein [Ruminococcus flavefaciens]